MTVAVGSLAAGAEPSAGASAPDGVAITSKTFTSGFIPDDEVTADGSVWLMSPAASGSPDGCRLGRLDPSSLAVASFRLEACGMALTSGDGQLFVDVATPDVKDQTYVIHVEAVVAATHAERIFPTVSATLALGSDIAHTSFAYAAGFLWFVGDVDSRPEVLQLSASTGSVVHVYQGLPSIGVTPLIATTPGVLWVAGGAGTGLTLMRIVVATDQVTIVTPPGRYGSVYALASGGDRLEFLSLDPAGTHTVVSRVGLLSAEGTLLATSPAEPVGSFLVRVGSVMYSVGPAGSCSSPLVSIWRIGAGLRTSVVTSLQGNPCLGESGGRPVVAQGTTMFVLDSSGTSATLYRIALGIGSRSAARTRAH